MVLFYFFSALAVVSIIILMAFMVMNRTVEQKDGEKGVPYKLHAGEAAKYVEKDNAISDIPADMFDPPTSKQTDRTEPTLSIDQIDKW